MKLFAFFAVLALSLPSTALHAEETRVDLLSSYASTEHAHQAGLDQQLFHKFVHKAARSFDDICGDTYCEGEFANIIPFDFDCVVTVGTGRVDQCIWKFAAAANWVDERNNEVVRQDRIFRCAIPMNASVSQAADFFGLVAKADTTTYHAFFDLTIPGGNGASLYKTLSACFQQ